MGGRDNKPTKDTINLTRVRMTQVIEDPMSWALPLMAFWKCTITRWWTVQVWLWPYNTPEQLSSRQARANCSTSFSPLYFHKTHSCKCTGKPQRQKWLTPTLRLLSTIIIIICFLFNCVMPQCSTIVSTSAFITKMCAFWGPGLSCNRDL